MIDLNDAMAKLAQQRAVFHSEADFQHALAWHLQQNIPELEIRLEYPVLVDKWMYIDIWARRGQDAVAIELKYKTRKLEGVFGGETIHLKDQSAQDTGRYDFLKDVWRLEQLVERKHCTRGYALFLTNESSYWASRDNPLANDSMFRLHEGREVYGTMAWAEKAALSVTEGRDTLNLKNRYAVRWQPYSVVAERAGEFRYLLLEIS